MNYFKFLALIFGLAAFLKPFYMHLLPWDENTFLAKAYNKKRPGWIIPVVTFGLLLVAFTWYKYLTTDIPYSIVITILFSLTAVKGLTLLFKYELFQQWVAKMLKKNKGREIVLLDIGTGIFGFIIVLLAIFVY
ncbi:MAG: hypothetical protein VR72_03830 [Clostridiaceae bacterium BRH_c20a]|nr:MAG: hypothetical protein VR72_03830 [Clostridiaceae bacterium BRH_c20a]